MSSQTPLLKSEMIQAGAGAGKTASLIHTAMDHIVSYYKKNNTFPSVTITTFTRKATRELKERLIIKAIETGNTNIVDYISYSPKLQISTLHGVFHRFLQIYGHNINLNPGFTITSARESHKLFIKILKEQLFTNKIGVNLLEHYAFYELQKIIKQYILYVQKYPSALPFDQNSIQESYFKTQQTKPTKKPTKQQLKDEQEKEYWDMLANLPIQLRLLGDQVLQSWNQAKKKLAQITMNDLENMTLEVINQTKHTFPQFRSHFWFLDEYQDTSLIQKKILDVLTQNSYVFIVGDPQQSIYRFRGADSQVFLQKAQEVKASKNGVFKNQIQNFRSDPELLAFFNDFFTDSEKMESPNSNYDSKKEVARLIQVYVDNSNATKKQQIQAQQVEQYLKTLLDQGVSPENIAILSKKNKTLSVVGQYLKNQNIPIQLHSADSFRKRREVQDALFLLHFLLNPHNNQNLIGLLRTPYWRVPDQTLVQWMQKIKKNIFHNSLQQTTKDIKKTLETSNDKNNHTNSENPSFSINDIMIKSSLWNICLKHKADYPIIATLSDYLKKRTHQGIVSSFQWALESSGLMDLAYYQDPTGVREANLWKFIYELKKHELTGSTNLLSFVENLLDDHFSDGNIEELRDAVSAIASSGVHLMTVHSAKGLQFEHVILLDVFSSHKQSEGEHFFVGSTTNFTKKEGWTLKVRGAEDTRISSSLQKEIINFNKEEDLKEFDRLLYVALTRAKQTVTLIAINMPENNSWGQRFAFFKEWCKNPGINKAPYYSYYYDQKEAD